MDAFCVLWTKSKDVLFGPQTFDENSGKGNPEACFDRGLYCKQPADCCPTYKSFL